MNKRAVKFARSFELFQTIKGTIMKKFILLIPFILSGCTLLGPTYTGETTADDLLNMIRQVILIFFQSNP